MVMTGTIRHIVAFILAAFMFAISLTTAFTQMRSNWSVLREQIDTKGLLKTLRSAIVEHHAAHGEWPDDLEHVEFDREMFPFLPSARDRADRRVVDGWGRPLHYETDAEGFRLWSFGRDDRPGGEGLDTDLDGTESFFLGQPTFRQFVFEVCPRGMWHACAATGLLTFALCLLVSRQRKGEEPVSLVACIPALIVVLFAAEFVGFLMTVLHVPSGH